MGNSNFSRTVKGAILSEADLINQSGGLTICPRESLILHPVGTKYVTDLILLFMSNAKDFYYKRNLTHSQKKTRSLEDAAFVMI